jgi:hypothetical protein
VNNAPSEEQFITYAEWADAFQAFAAKHVGETVGYSSGNKAGVIGWHAEGGHFTVFPVGPDDDR